MYTPSKQDIRKETPTTRQYDWSYQTRFKGIPSGEFEIINDPDAKIDMEKLKVREPIGFYRDMRLFDDELDDNGCSSIGLKIRIMPSCFFILLRYYLRVDQGIY